MHADAAKGDVNQQDDSSNGAPERHPMGYQGRGVLLLKKAV